MWRGHPGIDANGYAWAKNMKRLLKETCAKVSKRKRKKLTKNEYANLQKHYRNILIRGISELPARPERPSGKRGHSHEKLEGVICFHILFTA